MVAVEEILAQTRDAACDSGIRVSTRTYKYRVILSLYVERPRENGLEGADGES